MHEGPPKIEASPEHIPTEEEVFDVFKVLVEGEKYTIRRKLKDEQGLYLLEIEMPEDADGGHTEYFYIRKGDYKAQGKEGGSSAETAVYVTYYDAEGIPAGGSNVAHLFGVDSKLK